MQPNTGIDLGAIATLFNLPTGATVLGVVPNSVVSGNGCIAVNIGRGRLYAINISATADYILAGSVFTCLYI
jgi:hypothetical protein